MPSRLKTLELQGYKTFANRTRFEFAPHITAIVGPNGSGKSNIADALRWVLGEQSYTLLRAHKTEDMIFAGSSQRPRAGLANVTVTFDNSEHWLPIDYTEVAITRRASRDGQNEYLLNGQRVRLKDIRDLLGHAGLSEHTYTFIGQGLVDAALALRPDERRQMLEGASGIGIYRQRREETLRRLETTRRNLERVQDILAELEPRLRRLERQARRSREAAQLQADLDLMLRDWYGYHWHRAQQRLAEARRAAAAEEDKRTAALARQQAITKELNALRHTIHTHRAQLGEWHRQTAELHHRIEAITKDLAVLGERRRAWQTRIAEWQQDIERLKAQSRDLQQRLAEVEDEIGRRTEAHRQAEQRREQARLALEELLRQRKAARRALDQAQQTLDRLTRRQAALEARLNDAQDRRERLLAAQRTAHEALPPLEAALKQAQKALTAAQRAHQRATHQRDAAQEALAQARAALQKAEHLLTEKRRALDALHADIAALEAQSRVLAEAEENLIGYAEGTRWLLKQAAKHHRLQGALSAHLEVPAELETAIAAALDRFAEAVVVKDDLARAPLDLGRRAPSRTALLPLKSLRPAPLLAAPADADIVGIAARLVNAPAELKTAVDALLGQVVIVRDRAAALRVLPALPPQAWAVTLEGEAFSPRGLVTVGKPTGGSALRRSRERRELVQRLQALQQQATAAEAEVAAAEQAVAQARQALAEAEEHLQQTQQAERQAAAEEHRAQQAAERQRMVLERQHAEVERIKDDLQRLQHETSRLQEEHQALQANLQNAREALHARRRALQTLDTTEANAQEAHWSTQVALASQALEAARRHRDDLQQQVQALQRQLAAREAKLTEAKAQVQALDTKRSALQQRLGALNAETEALQAQIAPIQQALAADESRLAEIEAQAEATSRAVQIAERHHTQAQLALTRAQEALDNLRRRIEEDLGPVVLEYEPEIAGPQPLPLEGVIAQLPQRLHLPEGLGERIKQKRAQLRRLGPVNPEAEEEYRELQARYDFLTQQMEDLRAAEANIRQGLAELEDLMQTAFHKTFTVVNREFSAIFTRLFGGGSARLILTDPDDVTRTGVEIEARLPGKRTQRLAMLSGGERSLTAVALIFALLKASPTPFCVLDEVDAMLDEANVGRFRDLLSELSEHTQFVIITHNRNTVQAAEVIYGVTLASDATSQVISLKLDDVTRLRDFTTR